MAVPVAYKVKGQTATSFLSSTSLRPSTHMAKSRKQDHLFPHTMRDLKSLSVLLDGPIIKTTDGPLLTTAKPLTPAQTRALLKKTFKSILDTLHYARLELELRNRSAWEQLQRAEQEAQERAVIGNKLVIKPKPILAKRKHEILAVELKLVSNMFKEVLHIYETLSKTKYQPQGTIK